MVRSAKIFISTARGSTSGGTPSFLRKNFAQTLHPDRKATWRSDFNKEFGIVHFEHQTIENTALPATWLRQVNPQPQNRRERAYSHRQNALFGILFTPPQCWNEIISPYSLITTSQRRFLELNFTLTDSLYWFFRKYRQFSKVGCVFAPIAKKTAKPYR